MSPHNPKVVGNEKEGGGVKKVANDRNWPQTPAIEVCLHGNFAVVFDFMYFRFRPSKAKWIGNFLTIRQNAANYLQRFFFWSTFVCCVIRPFHIKISGWITASILKTERYCPRHYMDAMMPLAPLGKAQQYCSVFNFQLAFGGLFLQFAPLCLRTPTDSVRQ
jgi:hypothetical protein